MDEWDARVTFEDICLALRRNDPSHQVVGSRAANGHSFGVKLTNANAHRLGEDLHRVIRMHFAEPWYG